MDLKTIIYEHQTVVEKLLTSSIEDIKEIADFCREAVRRGNTVFLCGNGGSAADCQHIAAEFVGRFVKERKGLPAVALTTDTSAITAIGNDYGYKNVFKRQVESLVKQGDVLIAISTSGNSESVLMAVEAARENGAKTIGFTGLNPSKLSSLADICLKVPATVTARIQECHILVGHMICQYIDEDYE